MDTRKLKVRISKSDSASIIDQNTFEPIAKMVIGAGDKQDAAELVRRWNSFSALVEALRNCYDGSAGVSLNVALQNAQKLVNELDSASE